MSRDHHRPEDFEPPRWFFRVGPFALAMLALGIFLSWIAAAHFGAWYQRQIHARQVAKLPMCTPAAPAVPPTCKPRFSCSGDDLAEYRRACGPRGADKLKPKG